MVPSSGLILIGYWNGPGLNSSWPAPEDFVDDRWDPYEREIVADYLTRGHVVRSYMGYSTCRLCGIDNGDLELTDGTYVWPDGLSHYVRDHGVRLPQQFESHLFERTDSLEAAERDVTWWRSVGR